jgi:hypothetical protein
MHEEHSARDDQGYRVRRMKSRRADPPMQAHSNVDLRPGAGCAPFDQRAVFAAYFLRNLSTRPAVSTIFCLPV